MTPTVAIWLSRHPYPNTLPALLPDHTILHVRGRWRSWEDAWFDGLLAAGCHPDAAFYVLPFGWRKPFVHYVTDMSPRTLLIQPALLGDGRQVYKRTWVSRVDGRVYWEQWFPEEVYP